MRLRQLRLHNYGSFRDTTLDLAADPGRITLIVAPNGAGKSVLRRAFHDLLFDIPVQSPMKFRFDYPGMALHADAIDADGAPFGFGWVRGAKPARVTTDPARFARLRNGVTLQQLEQLFLLDTARLRQGGTDLKGGATLAAALLAGTGELASAKSVRTTIDARRHANWSARSRSAPLNAAAKALEDARKSARAAVQRPESRERDERELDARRQEYAAARTAQDNAQTDARRLHRIELTRPHLANLQTAEDWLAENRDAPALPPGLDEALAKARGDVATALAARAMAQKTHDRAAESATRIERDQPAAQRADQFDKLSRLLGEAENKQSDIVVRIAEHATATQAVQDALRDIAADLPAAQAEQALPPTPLRAEARAAITTEAALRSTRDSAQDRARRAAKDRNPNDRPATAPAPPIPPGLAALLTEIRRRDPATHTDETTRALHQAEATLAAALAATPSWPGTAPDLRALTLPAEAAFDRLDAARQAARDRARTAQQDHAKLTDTLRTTRQALDLLHPDTLPDTAAITAVRAARDTGMRLVLRHAFATPPTPAEDHAYAPGEPLALAYERHVRTADTLADRRAAELKRVQDADRLAHDIRAVETQLPPAEAAASVAVAASQHADADWGAAVAPLHLPPDSAMAELRAALAGRTAVIDALRQSEAANAAAATLAYTHHALAIRLSGMLQTSPAPLPALLTVADERIATGQAAERAAVKRQAELDAAQRTHDAAHDDLHSAEATLATWQSAWTGLLHRLDRPNDETPAAMTAVLDGIESLDRHHRAAAALARRIADMHADLARFADTVTELAQSLNEPLTPDPAETARRLLTRATRATRNESAWTQAQAAAHDQAQALADTEHRLDHAQAALAAVIAACGAATPEDADLRIAAARDHALHSARRDTARRGLDEHGNGLPHAQLQTDADAVPPDQMPFHRDAADAAARDAATAAEAAAVQLSQLGTALDADATATAALDTRADYEAAAATFARRLEEQLVLHLASAMLGDAMRTVEDSLGETSLARVSGAFSAVTADAYALELHDGPDGDTLHAVERAYPNERKSLDDLSEGTRDQLYLALRMVALREHCEASDPLPFIADDILQTFDDTRAAATLDALATLSHALQVIVLTHHGHLEHLATKLGPDRAAIVRL